MKQLRYIVPVLVLLAALMTVTGCNQAEDPATMPAISNPSAFTTNGIEVDVDICPCKPANRVNCWAPNKLIAVAIITTDDFNALDVDHTTVCFQGAYEAHIDPDTGEPERHEIDVEGDGDKDLVFHFLRKDTDLTCDSKEGCLEGYKYAEFGGERVYGCDVIHMFSR